MMSVEGPSSGRRARAPGQLLDVRVEDINALAEGSQLIGARNSELHQHLLHTGLEDLLQVLQGVACTPLSVPECVLEARARIAHEAAHGLLGQLLLARLQSRSFGDQLIEKPRRSLLSASRRPQPGEPYLMFNMSGGGGDHGWPR